jgi:menaquinone-dependent protoporphyrinogen oxidase
MSPFRILVVYSTSHGQTAAIARALADRLRHHGRDVVLADVSVEPAPAPAGFDAIVIGSRIHIGKHAAGIHHYVAKHRTTLSAVPTSFFTVSMSAAGKPPDSDPNGYLEQFFRTESWRPNRSAAFGGALPYRRYGWVLRQVMRAISKRGGHSTDTSKNHEYTDWSAVRDFADAIDGDLVARSLPTAATP